MLKQLDLSQNPDVAQATLLIQQFMLKAAHALVNKNIADLEACTQITSTSINLTPASIVQLSTAIYKQPSLNTMRETTKAAIAACNKSSTQATQPLTAAANSQKIPKATDFQTS